MIAKFLKIFSLLLLFSSLSLSGIEEEKVLRMGDTQFGAQVLYLIHCGKIKDGLESYLQFCKENSKQDLELLQKAALQILEQGSLSTDPEIQLMSVFGAGISGNTTLFPILENALQNPQPTIQLAALNFLGRFQDDEADEIMLSSLSSPFLIIRLEAAFHLAQKKHPKILAHIESLMYKLPEIIKPIFPQIFAEINNPSATKILRQFFTDTDRLVRIETILHAAETERDDLLPQIRTLATHPDVSEQEACALALGILKDEKSIPLLSHLASSSIENVQLAASYALYLLGNDEKIPVICSLAAKKNPFAIFILGNIEYDTPELRRLLAVLAKDEDLNTRINAAIALLKRKDPQCVQPLQEILIKDGRDLVFREHTSTGRALKAWKAIPSSQQQSKETAIFYANSLNLREKVLLATFELPDSSFMKIARSLFSHKQYDLIPTLVDLLGNKQTAETIELLKEQQQKAGAPLIRNYCNLQLFRLNEPGPYEDHLRKWVKEQQNAELIRFREVVPRSQFKQGASYLLTPEETSRLLIESFEALASCQNENGIESIVHAIAYGNSKNKYALAGLLLKTIE